MADANITQNAPVPVNLSDSAVATMDLMFSETFEYAGSQYQVHLQQGDAMAPEFPEGTLFIVDTSIRHYVKDGLYLLNYPAEFGMPATQQVKRVIRSEHRLDTYMVHSDNAAYPPFEIYGAMLDIAGLVVNSILCRQH